MPLLRRRRPDAPRVRRQDRMGRDPVKVGLVALILVVVGVYLGFSKHIPFTHGFRVKAVFRSAQSMRVNSPVRIAGVNVGKVKDIERYGRTDYSVVTMEISKAGLPIHRDATMKIRPRIFLEGNYFVDVKPGTPDSPTLHDGDTVKVGQTSTPVQLDEVLTALNSNSRQDLKDLLGGYGEALTHKPTPAEDKGQDPAVRGETAAKSLNDAFKFGGPAFKNTAIVNDALLGTEPHDLSKLVRGFGRLAGGLDRNEQQLKDLVTNFNTTVGALASQEGNLRASIHELGPTLRNADAALASLNRAFPPTRAFAREVLPGVRETPATINAAFPWIKVTRGLLSNAELRGLARDLRPTTANLANVVDQTIQLLPQVDLVARCATDVVLPTGNVKIDDGSLSGNVENYKEFWWTMVGLAAEGQNFDGNGEYVHFQPGGGANTVSTGTIAGRPTDQLFGNALTKPIGTRPVFPGKRPPYRPDFPCFKNTPPDLNGAAANVGPPDASTGGAPSGTQPGSGITLPPVPAIPGLPGARKAGAK